MLTPKCSIASAVVASAAIPLAFESVALSLPGQESSGLIVDGGVLANFPTFVFKDASYRSWAGLPPQPPFPVVGFLLDEASDAESGRPDYYLDSELELAGEATGSAFRPRREPAADSRLAQALRKAIRVITWPVWKPIFDWIPSALRWNAGGQRGNWPEPRSPVVRTLVAWFDALMTGIRPWSVLLGGFLVVTLCIAIGAYFAAWSPLAGHIGEVLDGEVGIGGAILGTAFWLVWALVPIYAWMAISMALVTAWLLHRTVQVTGYGLMRTFLSGSGAPVWSGAAPDDHVVRLRVPSGIDNLTVSLDARRDGRRDRCGTRSHSRGVASVGFGQDSVAATSAVSSEPR